MDIDHATQAPQPNEEAELFNPDYFLKQTLSIARKKGYPALQQALMEYHQARTLPQYSEKVAELKQQLVAVIDCYPNKNLDYLRRLQNHLNAVQSALKHYAADPPSPIPSRLHFSCIGQPLTQREQQHLALWQTVQEASGESLTLWYDSDALWVDRLNQCMLEAAIRQSFQQQLSSSTRVFLKQLSQNLAQLRESSYQAIRAAIASGQSADHARQQLLITRYQQPAADLRARLEEHQRVMQQLFASGITPCDLQGSLNSRPLAHPYQRELLQRGNLAAATQLASLQLLEQSGGLYGTSHALPPLSEGFWSSVTQIYLQQQGMSHAKPQQITQTLDTIKTQWLRSIQTQAITWQYLWKHNPGWMPEATALELTFTEHDKQEESALLQAINRYAQSKPTVTTVFKSMDPLAVRRSQGYWVENAVSYQNPPLLAFHSHSELLQAVIQQIQANYQLLDQLEQSLREEQLTLQDRDVRIEAARRLALPSHLARALADYYVEGVSIGADANRVLSGIGALQQGAERYYATQLLPAKLLKTVAPRAEVGSVNQLQNQNDSQPFSSPCTEQTAQAWYQQSKARYVQQSTLESEQQRLDLLGMIADQPIGMPLPDPALSRDGGGFEGILGWLRRIDQHVMKNDEIKVTGLSYELAKSLLTLIPRVIHQLQDDRVTHTALTRSEQLEIIARALLGMGPAEVLVDKVQQGQLDQINHVIIAINRKLLKNTLTHAVDTLVYGEIMLQLDPVQKKQRLVYRPQILNVAAGINKTTLPNGNFLSRAENPNKSVLFTLGEGDHQVTGVLNKCNQFLLAEGRQCFQGGQMADCFILHLSAKALQRQIALARKEGLPCYRLDGGGRNNKLLIQSEVKAPAAGEPLAPVYVGYHVDLHLGRVWMRQHNPADPTRPVDQAVLLMTLNNINEVEISTRLPTHSVIQGSDRADNTVTLHRQDRLYTGGGKNRVIIQGGVSIHSPSSGNYYRISEQVNRPGEVEIRIREARAAKPSILRLPAEHHQLTAWRLVGNDLIVGLGTQPQSCQLILADVYQTADGQRHLVHDNWRLFTQDGLQLLPHWPAVARLEGSPSMSFTAYYAKAWDQRPGAAAVTSTCSPYQLQLTPPDGLAAATTVSNRLIEDLSALEETASSAITMDSTVEVATHLLPMPLTGGDAPPA